jgi:hypothetical protein
VVPRGVDHVLRLRSRGTIVGFLLREPCLEVERAARQAQEIAIDPVTCQHFRRRRHTQHGHTGGDRVAKQIEHVGMADHDSRAGILDDVIHLLRLEVPVHRHGIGAERHHRIGGFQKSNVVAHDDTDAVARSDAEALQATRNAADTVGDFGKAAAPIAGDNAAEERGSGHCLLNPRTVVFIVITGLVPVIHVLLSFSLIQRRGWPGQARP